MAKKGTKRPSNNENQPPKMRQHNAKGNEQMVPEAKYSTGKENNR